MLLIILHMGTEKNTFKKNSSTFILVLVVSPKVTCDSIFGLLTPNVSLSFFFPPGYHTQAWTALDTTAIGLLLPVSLAAALTPWTHVYG